MLSVDNNCRDGNLTILGDSTQAQYRPVEKHDRNLVSRLMGSNPPTTEILLVDALYPLTAIIRMHKLSYPSHYQPGRGKIFEVPGTIVRMHGESPARFRMRKARH